MDSSLVNPSPVGSTPPVLNDRLAEWVAHLPYEAIPAQTVACSKRLFIDALAVAWAGSRAVGLEPVHRLVVDQGGTPESRVWVSGELLPATSAAFINGMYASALDFDSVHDTATIHADIIVIPALLAIADRNPMHGKEFLATYVAATEMLVRLGMGAGPNPGWFLTSALGVFASAACCARALGLGEQGVRTAMGIALSRASGTQQTLIEGSFTKRLQSAFAARDGVEAALLASCGVTAPRRMFEGERGFDKLYVGLDASVILQDLGAKYVIESITLKNYPSCFCNHAAIVATLDLVRKHKLTASQVSDCSVVITPFMASLVGSPFDPSDSPQVAAQFSVQYSVASVLLRGGFRLEDIDPASVLDAEVLSLARRVRVEVDASKTGKFVPASVRIRTHSGEAFEATANQIPGTPALPLPDAALREKALNCLTGGPRALSRSRAEILIAKIDGIETLENVQDLWLTD